MIVNLNLREDIYPEYPIIEGMQMRRAIKDVFDQWKEDNDSVKKKAYDSDLKQTQRFAIQHLTRNKEDQDECLKII